MSNSHNLIKGTLKNMELRTLRYFLAIAEDENMTIAANRLHLSQSALSRQLTELEDTLGRKLFLRAGRRMLLTEDGLLFRQRADEIVTLHDRMEAEFLMKKGDVSGDILIGAGETNAIGFLADTIRTIHRQHSGIRFRLFSGNADDVTHRLDHGLLDFGLLFEPVDTEKYEHLRLPASHTVGILMRKDSPYANQSEIHIGQLADMPLMIASRQNYRDHLFRGLNIDLSDLNVIVTYNLLFNASVLVEQGAGCALAIDGIINTSGDSPLKFTPLTPKLTMGLLFVWRKGQILSAPAQLFLQMLKNDPALKDDPAIKAGRSGSPAPQ